jgi:two-component system, OmpR family, sensor histidine kinase KdpD
MAGSRSFPALARTYAETLAMVAASTGLGLLIAPKWGNSPVDLLYLPPVLFAASLYGLRPALVACVASALAFNFFFTEPVHSLAVHSPADIVTMLMLFGVALVVSQLAARIREQARIAAANAARNATIAGFAGRLLSCPDANAIGAVTCAELSSLFDANAVLFAEGEMVASTPDDAQLTPADTAAASWVLEHSLTAGRGAPRLNPAEWLFFPVKSAARTLAALGLARGDGRAPVSDERLPLLESLLDQTALALERAALEREMRDVDSLRERDRLRGALLSSVGHDLRTPLTAIAAAAAELRREESDKALVATLEAETATLDRYISNLLDMARIEAGAVRLKCEPIDLVDAVSAATRDLHRSLAGRSVTVDLPADLPLVRADPHLLHHCLINIIGNAARHSDEGAPIAIAASRDPGSVRLSVQDQGPGLPDGGGDFDRFAHISGTDRTGGAGLGLAIVKGFTEAMGVIVAATNRRGAKGALVTLIFPEPLVLGDQQEGDGARV